VTPARGVARLIEWTLAYRDQLGKMLG
jgi:hypothetical protein